MTDDTTQTRGSAETLDPLPDDVLALDSTYPGMALADQVRAYAADRVAAERERAARVCDDEARIRTEAGQTHPEDSDSRGRCFAAARAAMNCAKGVRNGEKV